MAIIGFSFTKFDCERNNISSNGKIEISHNVKIDSVSVTKFNSGSGFAQDVLKFDFTFTVGYSNGLGHIKLLGDIIFSDTSDIIKEVLTSWNNDKSINPMINSEISKFVYSKGIVKALDISDNLNLPAPIPIVPSGMFDGKSKKND